MKTALPVNITVDQGADLFVEFNITDKNSNYVNLEGYSVQANFSRSYESVTPTYSFDASIPPENVDVGLVTLSLKASIEDLNNNIPKTSNLRAGRYVYNIYLTDQNGEVTKYIEGIFTVVPGVL